MEYEDRIIFVVWAPPANPISWAALVFRNGGRCPPLRRGGHLQRASGSARGAERSLQQPDPLLDGEARSIAEVAAGGVDVEPVGRGQLAGEEAGQGGLTLEAKRAIEALAGGRREVGDR